MMTYIYEVSGPYAITRQQRPLATALCDAYGVDSRDVFRIALVNDNAYFWTYDNPAELVDGELVYYVHQRPRRPRL